MPWLSVGDEIADDVSMEPDLVIPLKTYRINPSKARIELRGEAVDLYLPPYFGRKRFRVLLDQLNVCDLTSPSTVESPVADVFRDTISIPYLFTTGPATEPTLLLMFDSPQRVPPLRAVAAFAPNIDLPFGWRSSRSRGGAAVDGVLLRASDATDVTDRLARAGANRITDPSAWLRANRDRVVDPIEAQQVVADETRRARLTVVANGGLYGSLFGAALILGAEQLPLALLGVPAAVAAASLALRRVVTRWGRTSRRSDVHDGDRDGCAHGRDVGGVAGQDHDLVRSEASHGCTEVGVGDAGGRGCLNLRGDVGRP